MLKDEDNAGKIFYRYIVPAEKKQEIISKMHSSIFSGHFGEHKTLSKIEERYYWPFFRKDTETFIRECDSCQKIKNGPRRIAPMKYISPQRPLELLAIDAAGPLIETERGNKYIQIVCDHFTKKTRYYAVKDLKARTTAHVLVDFILWRT